LHACAAYDVPSALTYRTLGAFHGATAPRLLPLNRTDSPPVVDITVRPGNPVIVGTAYDVVPLTPTDAALHCSPTLTNQLWLLPTPLALVHDITVCAVTTTHPVAVNSRPVPLYLADTSAPVAPSGPRFVPVISTFSPPDVANTRVPPNNVIAGTAYDVVALALPLTCAPTVTRHRKLPPTPSTLLHSTSLCATTTLQFAALNNSARPDDVAYCAVTTLPLSGPRFVPTIRTFVPPDVGIDASGSEPATADSDVIAGGVYDTFADAGDKLLL
jgi:hypothetical protein